MRERLHARRVAQVESEDLQPVAPIREVGLGGIAGRRVAGEAGGDDQRRPGAEQLDPGLVADLDAAAGEERHPAAEVGGLAPLGEVEVTARLAELVVEVVHHRVALLAHVAVPLGSLLAERRVVDIVLREVAGREHIRGGEHRLAAHRSDAGLLQHPLLALDRIGLAAAGHFAEEFPPRSGVGGEHLAGGVEQPVAHLVGHVEQ